MNSILEPRTSPLEPDRSHPEPRAPSHQPKISIVTPSYNQGKYLEKTIRSVLEQGYPNLEYIIVDGGSTDESVEIIKKYQDRLAWWVSEPDRGQSHAINKGFERATGEIFGWLNSDDWYHPGALQAVADAFAANPEAGAVVGGGDMTDEFGNVAMIDAFPVSVKTLYGAIDKFFAQPSCFFRNYAWKTCGPLDESLHLAMDLDLWIKIAKKYSYSIISENLSTSLIHSDAKTTARAAESYADAAFVIAKHGGIKEARSRIIRFIEELLYKRKKLANCEEEVARLMFKLNESNAAMENVDKILRQEIQKHLAIIEDLSAELQHIKNSKIWKLTQPIRSFIDNYLYRKD